MFIFSPVNYTQNFLKFFHQIPFNNTLKIKINHASLLAHQHAQQFIRGNCLHPKTPKTFQRVAETNPFQYQRNRRLELIKKLPQ